MFHVKHYSRESYCELLKFWDSKHRILGKVGPDILYQQSLEALRSKPLSKTIVDVGAGNGILGIPALIEGLCERIVLIEPLPKKVAFLEFFRSKLIAYDFPRPENVKVVASTLENVSRETLELFAQEDLSNVDFVVRAFSGSKTLDEAFEESELPAHRVFDFFCSESSTGKKYVLKKVEL